jgi:hypothetical protein
VLAVLLLFTAACAQPAEKETAADEPAAAGEDAVEEAEIPAGETEEEPAAEEDREPADESSGTGSTTEEETAQAGDFIRLYYYGPSALGVDPATLPGDHCIYSATSSDGVNFTEDPGVRFAYDTGSQFGITDADVVRLNDGSWLMFLSLGTQLLKATAADSLDTFTPDGDFHWNQGGIPGSFNFEGTVRTFFCNHDIYTATYDQNSGELTGSDVAIEAPPSGIIADPSVIEVEGTYLMFYKYADAASATNPAEHEIYLATSADGIEWTQHQQNRFICKGSVPGAVYYNGNIYVYHCGLMHKPGTPPADLGLAISRDKGETFTTSVIKIEGKKARGAVDPAAIVISPSEMQGGSEG